MNLVTEYMNEVGNYGGIPMRRGDIINDLRELGGTLRQINLYLLGLDTSHELSKHSNKQGTNNLEVL